MPEYKPFAHTYTVADIYGETNPSIPDKCVSTEEFRFPEKGEYFLLSLPTAAGRTAGGAERLTTVWNPGNGPRIILRRMRRWTVEEIPATTLDSANLVIGCCTAPVRVVSVTEA